jgi:hypothetical protein
VSSLRDFSDVDAVAKQLAEGFVCVSEKPGETGVEYLVPFKKHGNGQLVVAFVQCKFRPTVNWADIATKLVTAMKPFRDKKIFTVPVVLATTDHDQQDRTFAGAVCLDERDVFRFTSKLGVLRMHVEKLGKKLSAEYPFLQ